MTTTFTKPDRPAEVQQVLTFAQAQASAAEIESWRRDLIDTEAELETAMDTLKKSQPFVHVTTLKERRKELDDRIRLGEKGLCSGLANARK